MRTASSRTTPRGSRSPSRSGRRQATGHKCDLTPDDPQFAQKLAWNVNYRWQGGSGFNIPHWGFANMRNYGRETWRISQGEYRRTYFSARADLLPETTELEPGTNVEWAEYFDVKSPFDLRGTMFLLYRYRDGKEDDTWAYIPALRRVRRIAATQKSDSLLGTEFTLEDFYMFSGYVWDHAWEYKGEQTLLARLGQLAQVLPARVGEDRADQHGRAARRRGVARLPLRPVRRHADGRRVVAETRLVRARRRAASRRATPTAARRSGTTRRPCRPGLAVAYDRAGKPFKILSGTGRWSESTDQAENKGRDVLLGTSVMIVNVQSNASNLGQFDGMNAMEFGVAESRKYYDTTKLKTAGR